MPPHPQCNRCLIAKQPLTRSSVAVLLCIVQVLDAALETLSKYMAITSPSTAGSAWEATVALFTAGEVALLKEAPPPGGLVVRVQALTSLAQQPHAAEDMIPGQAWVCLGKLSLADEALAKKCLPLFVQARAGGTCLWITLLTSQLGCLLGFVP